MAGVPGQLSGGANAKPTEAHRPEGTRPPAHRHRAVPDRVTGPAGEIPKAPTGLSRESRRLWRAIYREFDISSAPTLELLESALRSRDLAERARLTLEHEGLMIADKSRQPKAHPLVNVHRNARAAFVSTMRVLGFPAEDK